MALRVLLADESSTIKKVIQLALQDFGVEVKSVPVGIDVLPLARSFHPDLILADVLLAKRNGYEICADIKNDPELKNIPTVLMWSGFMELDEAKAKMARADRRLEKPFDADTLRRLVKDLVPTTQGNVIANYLSFPELPDFVDGSERHPGRPAAKGANSQNTPSAQTSPKPKAPNPLPTARAQAIVPAKEIPPTEATVVADFDEPEEFQQVPLPKSAKPNPNHTFVKDSEVEEAWSHQDLNKFKVELPEENFSIDIDEGELTRTSIALSDSADEIELGEIDNPAAKPRSMKPSLAERISEVSNTYGGLRGEHSGTELMTKVAQSQPMQASPVYIDTERAEEIIRQEARSMIKDIAWAVIPDICERVVREELQKLLKDAERL